ncbi:hypothetical protein OXB_2864 [Bacillus sp. OxB-1]|uniref:hypothetical protein n=1 Tax=Bacillus sp. (strain OxB-1) TaxID=98228 RepID=UPI000581CE76|nr:hypothetical protein [Bacillus sp. OxB-1]BAQ11335.1 hypothetical protein OXB_2864 [Bacillus sp. OxB-1]
MRTCSQCGWEMSEGFLHEDSGNTYCTTDCLNKEFSAVEREAMSVDELFWTDWHYEKAVAK